MTVSANNYPTSSKGTADSTNSSAVHSKDKGPFSAFGQIQAGTAAIVYQALTQLWNAMSQIIQASQSQAEYQASAQEAVAQGNASATIAAANDQKKQLLSQAAGSFASAGVSLGSVVAESVGSNISEQNTWNNNAEKLTNLSDSLSTTAPESQLAIGSTLDDDQTKAVNDLLNSGNDKLTQLANSCGGSDSNNTALNEFKTTVGLMDASQQAKLAENINTAQNAASQRATSLASQNQSWITKVNMYSQIATGCANGGSQVAQGIYQGRAGQDQAQAAIESMAQQQMSQAYQNTMQQMGQANNITSSFISLLAQASGGGGGVQG